MHKHLQQRYLATLRKCAAPMSTSVAQTITTQPQRQQQAVQKQQELSQQQIYTVSSPQRYDLPRHFGQCFDCLHVAAVTRHSSRSHGTSATAATTTNTPVTAVTVRATAASAAADDIDSAETASFLITSKLGEQATTTRACQRARGAEVK